MRFLRGKTSQAMSRPMKTGIFMKLLFYAIKKEGIRISHKKKIRALWEVLGNIDGNSRQYFAQRLEGAMSMDGVFHNHFQV